MAAQPNVVLVITDDQGYPALGSSGHPFIRTPHLDAFHDESVRFTDFHSGTTCAPTRAGLFTGRYCNSTGVWHTIGGRSLLRRDEVTLASALRDAGYRTGLFGKWHLGDEYPYRPQDRGFDEAVCHGGGGVSQQPDWWGNDYFDDTYLVNGTPMRFSGYCTDVFFAEAMRFIETSVRSAPDATMPAGTQEAHASSSASRARPFFCVVSTNAPHSPFNVAHSYRDRYTASTESEAYARFLGMCTNIDENFGRLRSRLRELEIEDETILIFMSDNGQTRMGDNIAEPYNAGMRGFKGSPYEGGHRIPFFVRWPAGGVGTAGGAAGDVEVLSGYTDVMPTLLDLCGAAPPPQADFDGRSLAELLRGAPPHESWAQRTFVTDTQRVPHPVKWRRSCAMLGRWRLVNRDELYDLARDPGQTTDLAADHPEVVGRLREAYEAWWERCAEGIDRPVPACVGSDDAAETVLRSHDLRSDTDADTVWNQGQVRSGEQALGWWEIDARRAGDYEVELRRWPREAGHAVTAGIEGDDVDWDREGVQPSYEHWYAGGRAIACDQATVIVDESDRYERSIGPDDTAALLRVTLDAGPHRLRALFSSAAGEYCSAYYVYVRKAG
ncbi:MAG: arylsulfatase [Spirochaetota bacterium]